MKHVFVCNNFLSDLPLNSTQSVRNKQNMFWPISPSFSYYCNTKKIAIFNKISESTI